MRHDLLKSATKLAREAAERRGTEQQSAAIERAAKVLGTSVAVTHALYYGRADACSDAKALAILARRQDVLLERLDYETRRHQAETSRILAELNKEDGCAVKSGSISRQHSSDAPSGSAASHGLWGAADDGGFAWGVLS